MRTFSDLKAGEEILIKNAVNYRKDIIEKVTSIHIVVNGKKYFKDTGVAVRGPWFGKLIIPNGNVDDQVKRLKRGSHVSFYD